MKVLANVLGRSEIAHKMLKMWQDLSVELSFAEHLQGTYQTSCPYGGVYLFFYYLMLYVCMYVYNV